MASLLEVINNTRESTIGMHYAAAVAELEEKVKSAPLKKEYYIYSGCISKEVADELSHRFNKEGLKTTVAKTLTQNWYLIVEPCSAEA